MTKIIRGSVVVNMKELLSYIHTARERDWNQIQSIVP